MQESFDGKNKYFKAIELEHIYSFYSSKNKHI